MTTSETALEAEAGERLGPYRLLEPLGEVPFGAAWRAVDLHDDTPVIVKRVPRSTTDPPPELLDALVREVRGLARIDRPEIPTIYEVRELPGEVVVTFEPTPGRTLDTFLESGRGVSRAALVGWGCQILELLAEAHARGALHRHLGDRSVTLDHRGTLRLRGFGLTRLETDPSAVRAPEVDLGAPASVASDLHAVGALLLRLASAGPEPLLGRPEDDPLAAVLARAMTLERHRRFTDAAEMEKALREAGARAPAPPAAAALQPVQRGAAVVVEPAPAPARRWRGPRLAAAGVAVIAAAAAGLLLSRGSPPPPAPAAGTAVVAASAAVEPQSPAGLLDRALGLLEEGRDGEAEPLLERLLATELPPNPAPVLEALGTLRLRAGRTAEAVGPLERALALAPSADLHYKLGLSLAAEGRREEALEQLRSALELAPGSRDVRAAIENLGGAP